MYAIILIKKAGTGTSPVPFSISRPEWMQRPRHRRAGELLRLLSTQTHHRRRENNQRTQHRSWRKPR